MAVGSKMDGRACLLGQLRSLEELCTTCENPFSFTNDHMGCSRSLHAPAGASRGRQSDRQCLDSAVLVKFGMQGSSKGGPSTCADNQHLQGAVSLRGGGHDEMYRVV